METFFIVLGVWGLLFFAVGYYVGREARRRGEPRFQDPLKAVAWDMRKSLPQLNYEQQKKTVEWIYLLESQGEEGRQAVIKEMEELAKGTP